MAPTGAGGQSTPGSGMLRLTRAPFLLGGVVFNALGVSLALAAGRPFDLAAAMLSQIVITSAQLMVHFANDYYDLAADSLNSNASRWSGGSRALVDGDAPAAWAIRAAYGAGAASVLASALLVLVIRPDPVLALLIALALVLAWSYSAPPLRLVGSGKGEVGGAVLLAGLTPAIASAAHSAHPSFGMLLGLYPLIALQYAMLITVSLPDVDGDRAAGKGTLAVRKGTASAARSAVGAMASAYIVAALFWLVGSPPVAAAYLVWTPAAIYQALMVRSGGGVDPARWNRAGFWAIGLVMGSALTLIVALLWNR